MKLFIVLAIIFSSSLAEQEISVNSDNLEEILSLHLENLQIDLPLEAFEQLNLKYGNRRDLLRDDDDDVVGEVTSILNDFTDQIFENLKNLLMNSSLNTLDLPDTLIELEPAGKLNLTSGVLEDIATLSRHGDVIVTYTPDTNTVKLTLPIKFDDLKFSYRYHSKILFISSHGGLEGKIKSVKINAELSFYLDTYQAFLNHYDMQDTGTITIKFTGNSGIDWLTNAMTTLITATLHPLIVGEAQKAIRSALRVIIASINEIINGIFFPSTTPILETTTILDYFL